MKLIGYPESKLEPRKIVVYEKDETTVIAQIYADGSLAINGNLIYPEELKKIIVIKDNFFLFYDNVENVNP